MRWIAPALLLLAGCHARTAEPAVTQAWVRLPAVPGQPGAAYFTLKGGNADARLIRIESALVSRAELHKSGAMGAMGGAMMMQPLDGVTVPAGKDIRFEPRGMHAMLFGIDGVVKPGVAIPLRFGFANGTTTEAEAKTVSAGENAPY